MARIGDLVVNLTANTKPFAAGIGRAQSLTSRFMPSLDMIKSGLIGIGSAAAASASAFAAWGVKLAAETEQAEVALTTMLGSMNQAQAMMANIRRFAATTPFQQMDLINAAKQLLAFGSRAEDVMGQLQVLGDISAISGARLEDLVRIFGKVNATGRTSLENINEIATRNIPIYDTLIRQLGSTRDGLRTLASTGQITAADFNRALQSMTEEGGIFFEGMIKQSQTLAGQWSTLKDNVAQLAEALGKLLVPVLKDVVRITTEMIQAYQLFFSVAQAITGRKLVRLPEVQTGANRDAKLGAITRDTTQKNIAAAKLYAKTMAAEIKARLSHSISSAMKEADRLRVQLDIKPMLIGAIERGSTAALQQLERVRQQSRLDRIAETHRQRLRELNERILTEQREANAHLKAIEEAASKGIKLGVATI